MSETLNKKDPMGATKHAVLDLAGAACESGADTVGFDIRVEEAGPAIVVEYNGQGMSPEELERFFDASSRDVPFYGADEVHVVTAKNGRAWRARSKNPPEYQVTEYDGDWETGTRVEMVNYDAPDDIVERVSEEELREFAALDQTDWTALVSIHSEEQASSVRRLRDS